MSFIRAHPFWGGTRMSFIRARPLWGEITGVQKLDLPATRALTLPDPVLVLERSQVTIWVRLLATHFAESR